MSRPRDANGRFLPRPKIPKPWIVLATNKVNLGAEMRAANRNKKLATATSTKSQARFVTRAEAVIHLERLKQSNKWRYTIAKLF
jgi:hypothetical protein